MVRLERMILQNFKSFAGKVAIPFPSGFTAVCGANGSGKSNIVDALTFVLGVQSARAIRAHKLQNLIFNGARTKKAADFCEVTLELDNSDGKVPGYGKELRITRRITRSGISVYKINGHTAIKSKVLDLLSQAGLSPDGHNIIMQGDIMRIIEMSPKERREIIDDISGISEFNQKKEEALRKLERTEARVNEALAVVGEKQRRVEQLKLEKENAEKYQRLNAELRQALASSIRLQLSAARKEWESLRSETKGWQDKIKELDKSLAHIDAELADREKELKAKNDEIIAKRSAETLRAIDKVEAEILRKRDRAEFIKSQIEQFKAFVRAERKDISASLPVEARSFSSIISIPTEYATAISTAIGSHGKDIIVKTDSDAVKGIKWLKENKVGRARFLPLNKIRAKVRHELPGAKDKGFLGWALDVIIYDQSWYPAVSHVLGHTVIASDIEAAKRIAQHGIKVVTLDGDIIEPSGAMIGGYRVQREMPAMDLDALAAAREALLKDIAILAKELEELKKKEAAERELIKDLYAERDAMESVIAEVRGRRSKIVEEKFALQNRSNRIEIDKAKIEARIQELEERSKEFKDVEQVLDLDEASLSEIIRSRTAAIRQLGPVNMRAIEDYQTVSTEFQEMKGKLDKLLEEKASIIKTIEEVEKRRQEKFAATLATIASNFSTIYKDLTGGTGNVRLEDPANIDSGLVIEASPAGKNVIDLDVMSGGEKTVTSLAFLFAIMQHYASPLYIMDEIDAALDKANTRKVAALLRRYSKSVQFLVITHNDITSSAADKVFGVAMEDGASKIFGIEMPKR
ncbi:MAG: chromosome segregation SMC family protein [Candidatus Aenigmatarchaeota archaeon]